MGRPRKEASLEEPQEQLEESLPVENEAEQPTEKVAPVVEEKVLVKGKFILYRKGETFLVRSILGALVSQGLSESEAQKLLSDLNR